MIYKNVIMMHSVGSYHTNWKEKWLSVDTRHFESLCKYLCENGYKTGYLDRWYYLEDHPEERTKKDLFLTFDDGYLDNLLVAYPIMKKYGIKGTIFVNPEFVDPSNGIRTIECNKGITLGFLNWDEIKFLDKTEEFDIQSHSMSHNFYFKSNKLIDIHDGSDKYHWLAWISRPDRKPFWQLEEQGAFTPKGYPVFEPYRALGLRRYFPDDRLIDESIKMFNDGIEKDVILSKLTELQNKYPGHCETNAEKEERFMYELKESKRILEDKLNKNVDYLCWPGGGYDEQSLRIAIEVGYKASTIASRDCFTIPNNAGLEYKRIARFGMDSTISIGRYFRKQRLVYAPYRSHLIWKLKAQHHEAVAKVLVKAHNFIMRFF